MSGGFGQFGKYYGLVAVVNMVKRTGLVMVDNVVKMTVCGCG